MHQALSNFTPRGSVYLNAYGGEILVWEEAISRMKKYTSKRIIVAEHIKTIPIDHIRDALLVFHNRYPENYRRNDISACMRNRTQHCNQYSSSKKRVRNQLSLREAIWGFNEAFHIIYPFAEVFLNVNHHLMNLNPTLYLSHSLHYLLIFVILSHSLS